LKSSLSKPSVNCIFSLSPSAIPRSLRCLLGQLGENGNIDPVLDKAVGVLGHAEFLSQSAICSIATANSPVVA
jgi:hypothetical protein